MLKEKSCGIIIYRKSKDGIKYLLLHYEEGHWDFPKGHQEKNETEQRAAERELKEETGIEDVEFANGFKQTITYYFKRGYETAYKEVLFFLGRTQTEKILLSDEHTGYSWVSYNNAVKRLTFENARELLSKANDFLLQNS